MVDIPQESSTRRQSFKEKSHSYATLPDVVHAVAAHRASITEKPLYLRKQEEYEKRRIQEENEKLAKFKEEKARLSEFAVPQNRLIAEKNKDFRLQMDMQTKQKEDDRVRLWKQRQSELKKKTDAATTVIHDRGPRDDLAVHAMRPTAAVRTSSIESPRTRSLVQQGTKPSQSTPKTGPPATPLAHTPRTSSARPTTSATPKRPSMSSATAAKPVTEVTRSHVSLTSVDLEALIQEGDRIRQERLKIEEEVVAMRRLEEELRKEMENVYLQREALKEARAMIDLERSALREAGDDAVAVEVQGQEEGEPTVGDGVGPAV